MDHKVCCVKGCELPVIALGMCNLHWRRTRKYGSPAATKSHSGMFKGMSAEERFNTRVRKTDGCWFWKGAKDKDGYGMFRGEVAGVMFSRAHRFSYAIATGDLLLGGELVMHSCDTPSCVNPAHLSAGSGADNTRDMIAKGRGPNCRGEAASKAILTEAQVIEIRKDPRPHTELADAYGVTASTINDIKSRNSWRHLDTEIVRSNRMSARGEKSYAAKITADIVREIRGSAETGKELAARYGVSPQTVTDIRKFRSWKHLS
jgi:hypothetical protein